MGVTYDCAISLLCSEDNSSILGLDEEQQQQCVYEEVQKPDLGEVLEERTNFYGDTMMGFPLQSEDSIALLFERESQHLPEEGYSKRLLDGGLILSMRNAAIGWIEKVKSYHQCGPLTVYLAVNYFDRFLSAHELPQVRDWMAQLLSVSCLSLAAKMEETEAPEPQDLQVANAKYLFETKTIRRTELLVLSTLKWRMQTITPFSFIHYFLSKFGSGNSPKASLIMQSANIILCIIRGIEFLDFRPSEVAAAVALTTLNENQNMEIEKALICCTHVDKERVLKCYEVIQNIRLMKQKTYKNTNPSASSVLESPIGVLDAVSVSYISDDTTVNSHANSHQIASAAKRRKLNR